MSPSQPAESCRRRRGRRRSAASSASSGGSAARAASDTVSNWIRAIDETSCVASASSRSTTRRARYGRVEIVADQVRVGVVVDAVVRRDQVAARGIDRPGQLLERDPSRPTRARRSIRGRGPCRRRRVGAGTGPCTGSRSCRSRRRRRSSGRDTPRPRPHGGTRRSWWRWRRRGRATDGCRSRSPSIAARTSRRRSSGMYSVCMVAHHGGVDDRTVTGLADIDHDRLGGSADADLLAVDRERFPSTVDLGGRSVVVQVLDVEVLDVAGHVRDAPRVVRRRAQQDAGRERERHATRLVARRPQVHLDPRPGLHRQQVRVVRQERFAARGPRTRDHPVVRPCSASGAGGRRAAVPPSVPAGMCGGSGGSGGSSVADRVGSQAVGDRRPEQLLVPVAGEAPRQVRRTPPPTRRRRRSAGSGRCRATSTRPEAQASVRSRRRIPSRNRACIACDDVVPSGSEPGSRSVEADRAREPVVGQAFDRRRPPTVARPRRGAAGRSGTGVRRPSRTLARTTDRRATRR